MSEQRLCRLAEAAARAEDPLRALQLLAALREELEAVTAGQVRRSLRAGRSFADVARALGVSRQAAHRRYRHLAAGGGSRVMATERARRVLRLAGEEALQANAGSVAGEHVLIAVLRDRGDAALALEGVGLTLDRARADARTGRAVRDADPPPAGLRAVLREAAGAVLARGEHWIDAGDLLLAALADRRGGARRLLAAHGADVASVRRRLDLGQVSGLALSGKVPQHDVA